MDGTIGVESEAGHGSRFFFTVSFRARAPASGDQRPGVPPVVRGERVLVGESNATARRSMVDTLVDAGMSVTCVTSADEARAWLGRSDAGQSVDLVFLSWRLDGSRTRDLLALARSTVGVAPNRVVVVASHADAEPAHASLRALGFGLLLIKPASPSAVFRHRGACFRRRAAQSRGTRRGTTRYGRPQHLGSGSRRCACSWWKTTSSIKRSRQRF